MSQLRVLITGGGRGIGRATALRFAREGAMVVVAARTSSELDAVVAEIDAAGGHGLAAQMNVADHGSVEAAVYRALNFTGGALDVLVNCAGTLAPLAFGKTDVATWNRHIGVNLSGPFFVTLESVQGLEESDRAHVFNVCAPAGREARSGMAAYCATQHGLRGLSEALRLDLGPSIKVTTVFPRPTNTALHGKNPAADRASMDPPELVAEAIWRAFQDGSTGDLDVSG